MSWRKFPRSLTRLATVALPVLVTFPGLPAQILAQSALDWNISLEFPPTDDEGAPPKIMGGKAGGSQCFQDRSLVTGRGGLTALTPTNNVVTTAIANPSLFIYVPAHTAQDAQLDIEDEEGNLIFQTVFAAPTTAGVIKLTLPKTLSLEIGKTYQWNFSLICDDIDRSNDEFVTGSLRRTALNPDLKMKIDQEKDPLKQATLYAEHRIWNETLMILSELREAHPTEWEELLESVKLEAIAQQPFINCCIVNQ